MSNSGSATPTPINLSANASVTPPTSRTRPHDNSPTRSLKNSFDPEHSTRHIVGLSPVLGGAKRTTKSKQTMVPRRSNSEDEREENPRSSPSCSSQGEGAVADSEAERSQPETATLPLPVKKKRTRTLTTPHQSTVLHALLAQSRFPTTAMREDVGRSIGLSARKVQIWFQNQRQKARRPRSQSAAPLARPPQYAAFPDAPGSAPMMGEYHPFSQGSHQRGLYSAARGSNFDHRGGPPIYRGHHPPNPSVSSESNQLSGPGMPGLEPRHGSLQRDRNLPDHPPLPFGHSGIHRSFRSRPYPDLHARPSLSPPLSYPNLPRPTTVHASGRFERDFSRTLPPLNFDPSHHRTSISAPGPGPVNYPYSHSSHSGMPPLDPRRSPSESPFAHSIPDHGERHIYNISPPFALQPRPQWDVFTPSSDSRPGTSSWSGRSRGNSIGETSSAGGYDIARGGAQDAEFQREDETVHIGPPPSRVGRYDPVRGMFVSYQGAPPFSSQKSPRDQGNGS